MVVLEVPVELVVDSQLLLELEQVFDSLAVWDDVEAVWTTV